MNVTMDDEIGLTETFESSRSHLRAVAYRMLGSVSEADDAVQEAWLRLDRADTRDVENLGGWLTTVVARVCLDMLRSRTTRREEPPGDSAPDASAGPAARPDPEGEALLADSIGPALLVVLDALTPPERLAFVLHDVFAVPFDEIAPIVDRSPAAARQLASRARRRVRGADSATDDPARRDEVVGAFLAAARDGDFDGLLAVLDPDVVLRADAAVVEAANARQDLGAPTLSRLVRGAPEVATAFAGRARTARRALIDGAPGAAWAPDGRPRAVFDFTIVDGRIVAVEVIADPVLLAQLEVTLLDG
jgi:RNA polymerase sigma factor (sigma-70 family)